MTGQLPEGAVGAAVGVFLYTTLNLVCSSLMIWLTWVHEKLSYVAFISYFAALSIVASMIQQIHDYTCWRDVITEQFEHKMLDRTNPELAIANGSVGLDLVLYYIQYYAYSVEAMFVLFWAVQLAQSVYGLSEKSKLKRILRILNNVGKVTSIVLPLITILCLRIPAVQASSTVFILLADLPLMLSLAIGLLLVFAILARYMNSRRKFLSWSNGYYNQSATGASSMSNGPRKVRQPSVYDRWLLVRFTIAFVLLGVFEVTNTLFQLSAQANNKKDEGATAPDFSATRAVTTIVLFMPGVTPGLVIFVVFGTTRVFRNYMYTTFVPKKWQRIPESAPRRRADSEAGLGGRMRAGSFASRDALRPMPPDYSRGNTRDHFSATDETLGIKLQEFELGRASEVQSHSSDERPILPIMKQAYHNRRR